MGGDGAEEAEAGVRPADGDVVAAPGEGEDARVEERGEGGQDLEGGAVDVFDEDPLAPVGVWMGGWGWMGGWMVYVAYPHT